MPYFRSGSRTHQSTRGHLMSSISLANSIRCARPGRVRMTRVVDLPAPRQVLVVDADPALADLIGQWLDEEGCRVVREGAGSRLSRQPVDLIIVDVPFPRQGRVEALRRVSREHPG